MNRFVQMERQILVQPVKEVVKVAHCLPNIPTSALSLDAIKTKPRMRCEARSPKILVSGN